MEQNYKPLQFDDIQKYTEIIHNNNQGGPKNYEDTYVFIVEKTTNEDGSVSGKEYYAVVSEKTEDDVSFTSIESRSFEDSDYTGWSENFNVNTYAGNVNNPVEYGFSPGESLTYTREQINNHRVDEDTELVIYDTNQYANNTNNKANQSAGARRRRRHATRRQSISRRRKSRKVYRRRR